METSEVQLLHFIKKKPDGIEMFDALLVCVNAKAVNAAIRALLENGDIQPITVEDGGIKYVANPNTSIYYFSEAMEDVELISTRTQ